MRRVSVIGAGHQQAVAGHPGHAVRAGSPLPGVLHPAVLAALCGGKPPRQQQDSSGRGD